MAFALGYQARSFLLSASPTPAAGSGPNKKRKLASPSASDIDPDESLSSSTGEGATDPGSDTEDETAALASDLAGVKASMGEEVKLVLVVNDSLKMSKGKIAAQAGHATLACTFTLQAQNPRVSAGSCGAYGSRAQRDGLLSDASSYSESGNHKGESDSKPSDCQVISRY